MDSKEHEFYEQGKALLEAAGYARTPWREIVLERLMTLALMPEDRLELRVTSAASDGDVFALARRAVDAFFSAFLLYPTSIAVHSTIAQLFEASELVIKAENRITSPDQTALMLGKGFEATSIRVEIDDGLDIHTAAVRFKVDRESGNYEEAVKNVLMRALSRRSKGGNNG